MPDDETTDTGPEEQTPPEVETPSPEPDAEASAPDQQPGESPEAAAATGEQQGLTPADLDAVLRAAGVDASKAAYVSEDFDLKDLAPTGGPGAARTIDLLKDVTLNVRIELGRTRMFLEDVLRLGPGSAVALDKLAGDAVDILVNGQLVARGEVIVLDENLCVRITEIVSPPEGTKDPTPEAT